MVLVVALADGVQARDVRACWWRAARRKPPVGRALVVHPQAAHRVVDGREDLHRHVARVDALEFLVDFQDAAQLAVELVARNVRQVEIHAQPVLLDAQPLVDADVEDLARGDVARHEVAVLRIALFEEVVPLALGNRRGSRGSCGLRGTHTRPPSPRAVSLISRSLSAPGIAVGWTWMNSPLAYFAPAWKQRLTALPVQAIDMVERP